MASLVTELQEAAQNPRVSVSDLLRKAKVVAHKLEQPDLLEWVEKELKGYTGDVPPYRRISADFQALDPFWGWKRVMFEDPRASAAALEPRKVGFSIPQLEELLNTSKGDLFIPAPNEVAAPIMGHNGVTEVGFSVGRATLAGILAAVRDAILDWSLKLEGAGVRGEGMSFTNEEKQKAHSSGTTINIKSIENFAGNISGELSGKAIVTATQSTATNLDVTQVKKLAQQIKEQLKALPPQCIAPVDAELTRLDSELSKSSPDRSIVRSALGAIGGVLEGAGGHLLAMGIRAAISYHLR